MMTTMTDEIRAELRAELARRGETLADVAREFGVSRTLITRMLSAKSKEPLGSVPTTWQKLFDKLGYKLIVVKDKDSSHA